MCAPEVIEDGSVTDQAVSPGSLTNNLLSSSFGPWVVYTGPAQAALAFTAPGTSYPLLKGGVQERGITCEVGTLNAATGALTLSEPGDYRLELWLQMTVLTPPAASCTLEFSVEGSFGAASTSTPTILGANNAQGAVQTVYMQRYISAEEALTGLVVTPALTLESAATTTATASLIEGRVQVTVERETDTGFSSA